MDQQRHGEDETSTRQSVLDVALTHHLVSRYTSLVAVDTEPIRPTDKSLVTHAMRTNLPEGQDYQAIFGLPKTATNGKLQILLGLIALAFASLVWRFSKADRMNPIRTTPCTLVMLPVCLLAVGLWQIGEGSWIYAKARFAQVLLQRAWSRTLAGEHNVKPWPWSDTWPVGRLRVPSQGIDLIVLNGAYGRTLAFGPGYAESSAFPGSPGTTILTGHRDTHFEFLKRLKPNDEMVLDTADGT
ncbi:MAG TPA: sortase, partial [Nitrospira sp.]